MQKKEAFVSTSLPNDYISEKIYNCVFFKGWYSIGFARYKSYVNRQISIPMCHDSVSAVPFLEAGGEP